MTAGNRPRRKPDLKLEKMDTDLLLFHPAQNTLRQFHEPGAIDRV